MRLSLKCKERIGRIGIKEKSISVYVCVAGLEALLCKKQHISVFFLITWMIIYALNLLAI